MIKKSFVWIVFSQILILLFCFIFYHRINLLSYINVSFVIGAVLILYAMAGYVIKGRFFDIVFYSFQYFFSRMSNRDRRPLSELAPQHYVIPFITGCTAIVLMLGGLLIYYFSL
ncbi:DUF3899 domain-containing protein [Oceanobacillus neutriphilus]|uniref:DUF3899 domain-containing protein n=1 Tax=Oceanobacillus neutriphilus TaxID=531815 RepID=A0ABQ2NV72_9BACI|nr:DUF3899 domain-containing protein [Oceanobacillus neutriphilus]GGP11370.1 hypothetical protein GCM10011346_23260 [Oceanobacillus neutriphilus]